MHLGISMKNTTAFLTNLKLFIFNNNEHVQQFASMIVNFFSKSLNCSWHYRSDSIIQGLENQPNNRRFFFYSSWPFCVLVRRYSWIITKTISWRTPTRNLCVISRKNSSKIIRMNFRRTSGGFPGGTLGGFLEWTVGGIPSENLEEIPKTILEGTQYKLLRKSNN